MFAKAFWSELDSFKIDEIGLWEMFEIYYILESYLGVIYEKTLPKILDWEDDHAEFLDFEFIKPLVQFKEKILQKFYVKTEDFILDFKTNLLQDWIFETPKQMNELLYILKGLVGIIDFNRP